jgi:hypothetical protein
MPLSIEQQEPLHNDQSREQPVYKKAMSTLLVEARDADFDWMIRGGDSRNGLVLPPGGVDAPAVLMHVRAIAQRLHEHQGHTDSWMIVANDEVVGLCGYKHPPAIDGMVDIGYSIAASLISKATFAAIGRDRGGPSRSCAVSGGVGRLGLGLRSVGG